MPLYPMLFSCLKPLAFNMPFSFPPRYTKRLMPVPSPGSAFSFTHCQPVSITPFRQNNISFRRWSYWCKYHYPPLLPCHLTGSKTISLYRCLWSPAPIHLRHLAHCPCQNQAEPAGSCRTIIFISQIISIASVCVPAILYGAIRVEIIFFIVNGLPAIAYCLTGCIQVIPASFRIWGVIGPASV